MDLEYVPLLRIQRDLHDIPRGPARFQAYIRAILNDRRDDVARMPLVAMNPMGREHVAERLDAYLTLDAESAAEQAVAEAASTGLVADVPGSYRVGLVMIDDLRGGWTNRYATEFGFAARVTDIQKRGWLAAPLWVSEPASLRNIVEAVRLPIHRAAYVARHGVARTLRHLMDQEGYAMAKAGWSGPTLDADDLAYTAEVIEPFLDADDDRTQIECLYGDAACRTLGFTPRGLSHRAGLALARLRARGEAPDPERPCNFAPV